MEVYKALRNLQGIYIPELITYGEVFGGMFYVIGMKPHGRSMRELDKLSIQQKKQAVNALKQMHRMGYLYNDIRQENILIDGSDVFLIDFGFSCLSRDSKAKHQELLQLQWLLDHNDLEFNSPSSAITHMNTS